MSGWEMQERDLYQGDSRASEAAAARAQVDQLRAEATDLVRDSQAFFVCALVPRKPPMTLFAGELTAGQMERFAELCESAAATMKEQA